MSTTLPARAAYRLWAASYEAETAVSLLDDDLAARLSPPGAGRLLDAGCGTGRRLPSGGACGVDLSWEMLAAGGRHGRVAVADVRALPFADAAFDQLWCRLVMGHLADAERAYAELARACRPGGTVLVTDFHAEAVGAGHRRTFRDPLGQVHEIEHYVYPREAHQALAARHGLRLDAAEEGRVGPLVEPLYRARGRDDAYLEQRGLPLVLALRFRRQ
jgi:malonyl-CoA O-methyltransferase